MRTDVDTALKDIADWFIKNRREMKQPEFHAILMKHCASEAEADKFAKFLETEPGQTRFKIHLRESQPLFLKFPLKEPPRETEEENLLRQIDYWQKYQNKNQNRDVEDFTIAIREMGMVGLWARYNIPRYPAYKTIGNYNVTYEPPIGDIIEHLLVSRRASYLKKPFVQVGDKIRFIGSSRGRFGDWPEGKWLEHGVTGVVKEYHPEQPAVRVGGEYFEALPHYAVARWDFGGETVIDPEDEGKRWERAKEERSPGSLLYEPESCNIVPPQYYDLLGLLDSVPPTSLLLEPEAKETKLDEILKKLKDGVDAIQSSPVFREFLITLSKFHDYSFGNCILIMFQKPNATRVAGFNTWKDLGRFVKKGEKGIAILAPCLPPKGEAIEETWRNQKKWVLKPRFGHGWSVYERGIGLSLVDTFETKGQAESWLLAHGARKVAAEEVALHPRYFKVVYVFDVSQTEGKELPKVEVPPLSGAVNEELFSKALALAKGEGLEVSFKSRPEQDPRVKGQYSGKNIWVRPEESKGDQLAALLHEEAHYFTESVFGIPRADAETIAESACFAVGAHFGFDTGVSSFPYVAVWSKDKKVLEKNLTTLRKVSLAMIQKLEAVKVASELKSSEKFSGVFTCVMVANLIYSDDPPAPTPVHIECWERIGKPQGYERAIGAKRFVVNRQWVSSLPAHTKCYLCHEEI